MSPASYLTAPPRVAAASIARAGPIQTNRAGSPGEEETCMSRPPLTGSRTRRNMGGKGMMTAEVPGANEAMYRQINETVGITAQSPPDGLVVHMAATTGDGMRIVDVWESAEAFRTFFEGIKPTMEQVGMPAIEPEMYPVHNM